MTGDAGERSLRIPAGNGEADAYSHSRDVLDNNVEGRKKQERYLCGPRLEAQLTGQKLQSRGAGQDGCQRNMV